MTSRARTNALGIILCCLVTWTPSETQKECKSPNVAVTCATGPIRSTCIGDHECNGKMCGITGCFMQCNNLIDPKNIPEKEGVCPYFDASKCKPQSAKLTECRTDRDCPGSCRCCCFDCKTQCMTTVRERPGHCPDNIMKECRDNSSTCQNDFNCPEGLKCCECCGKNCVKPIEEHPGVCPVSKERISCIIKLEEPACRNDAVCEKNQKCCLSGNQMRCVTVLEEKKGVRPDLSSMCMGKVQGDRCNEDGDKKIVEQQKCCGENMSKHYKYPKHYQRPSLLMNPYGLIRIKDHIPGECLIPRETVGDHPVAKKCCNYVCVTNCV